MLIRSLRMENFRQFRETTKVDFSCDPERNVTIILGDKLKHLGHYSLHDI